MSANPESWGRRFINVARAARVVRSELDPALAWTRAALEDHQERRWRALVRHAVERSAFYRNLYRGIDVERAPRGDFPPIGKKETLDHFDDIITDPTSGLTQKNVEAFVARAEPAPFAGRCYILGTSGTSGQRGLVIYDRDEWIRCIANGMRAHALMGNRPRLPRLRMATLLSTHASHISYRLNRSVDIGVFRVLSIDTQLKLDEILPFLEAFQPDVLFGYPSTIAAIAHAQLEGEGRIAPKRIVAGGEAILPAFRNEVLGVWNAEVFDLYATTETGALAAETPDHRGSYLFEDETLVEVVDENGRPVPDGERGHHLLVTPLSRRLQPLIRYRLSDQIIVDPPRGAGFPPFRIVRAIEGRVLDTLKLRNRAGEIVPLRPASLLGRLMDVPGIRQVRVVQESSGIHVQMVAAPDARAVLAQRVRRCFDNLARDMGLVLPALQLQVVESLRGTNETMGKFRSVEYRSGP